MLCLLIGPISKAQNNQFYHLLRKGEPSPFDTAVAVKIDRYRLESMTMKRHRELTDSLVAEIFSITAELTTAYKSNAYGSAMLERMDARSIRQDSTISIMKTSIDGIVAKVNTIPEYNFFNDWRNYAIITSLVLLLLNLIAN
jgi:hypothetical protein